MKLSHAFVLIALLSAIVWGPTLRHGFVWDDEYFVVSNTALRDWSYLPRYFTDISTMSGRNAAEEFAIFRPLRNISYLLDYKIAGLGPAWWHFHNILLHAINAGLVLLVARRMGVAGAWPALAAAIYLVHPVQTETVAWVKGRDDLLGAMFSLAAFAVWLGDRNRLRLACVAGLCFLACLAKDQCIALPLAIAAWEFWTKGRISRREWASVATFGAVGMIYLFWRRAFLGRMGQCDYLTGSLWTTMMTMTEAAVNYLKLMFFPVKLLADYSGLQPILSFSDPRVWICSAVLLAVAATAWFGRRRQPVATFGFVWIAVMLLPMSNLVPMMQFMAERFLYLPLAGFAFAAAALFSRWSIRAPKAAVLCAAALIAAYSARAAVRVPAWKDSRTLFAVTVRDTPPAAMRPRRQYLDQMILDGRFAEALPFARELYSYIQNKAATPRVTAEITRHLGYLLCQSGERTQGEILLREAMTRDSSYVYPYIDLGVLAGAAGSHEEALAWFDKAAAFAPDDASVQYNRGIALRGLDREAEAEAAFRRAAARGVESKEAHRALAGLLWAQGRREEAAAALETGLRLWPGDPDFQRWLSGARGETAP